VGWCGPLWCWFGCESDAAAFVAFVCLLVLLGAFNLPRCSRPLLPPPLPPLYNWGNLRPQVRIASVVAYTCC
jgi:hypothetical protein